MLSIHAIVPQITIFTSKLASLVLPAVPSRCISSIRCSCPLIAVQSTGPGRYQWPGQPGLAAKSKQVCPADTQGKFKPTDPGRIRQEVKHWQQHQTPLEQQSRLQDLCHAHDPAWSWQQQQQQQQLQQHSSRCRPQSSTQHLSQPLQLAQLRTVLPAIHQQQYGFVPSATSSSFSQQICTYSTDASGSSSTKPSSSSTTSTRSPKNVKGALPKQGPSARTLSALPYTVSRSEAAAAFTRYHSGKWYQSRQQPALGKPFKETYMPFWVGSGYVTVEVRGAEVGHEHLVTRYDRTRGRAEPRWETVWSRVQINLVWERQLKPEEPDMQIYASWKYFRQDVEALKPGTFVQQAKEISPDMLKATPNSGLDTRRVGPFTMQPYLARRLMMAKIESAERRRAEDQIAKVTGARLVRFVDMHCTWHGSTGAAAGGNAAASSSGGLDLMPVYVPAYVFSWWHGGSKVRTFVSGVNLATGGVHVLDDKKVATVAAAATSGLGLLLGLPLPAVFWGGLVVPFVAGGVVARFWPLVRENVLKGWSWLGNKKDQFWHKEEQKDYCDVDWNASFVRAFADHEQRHHRQEQRESFRQAHKPGGDTDPFANFQEFMQDPFRWFERQYAKTQQQQWQQQFNQQQQGGNYQQQQQQSRFGGASAGPGVGHSPRDPKGYYKTLGIEPGATTPEVQAAFRGLALQYHPDRYTEAAEKTRATKRFQVITEAYQVLRDPKKRRQYDAGQYMG